MGGEGIFTMVGLDSGSHHQIAVEGGNHHVIVVGAHLEGVGCCGGLATGLGDADSHVVVSCRRRGPGGVPIAVFGIVGIVGLQGQLVSIDIAFHPFEFQHVAVVDIGTQHNHHGIVEIGHINLGAFVGATNGDFWAVVLRIDDVEAACNGWGGHPLRAVASLFGTYFHGAFLAGQGEDVAFHGGGSFSDFEGHGKS